MKRKKDYSDMPCDICAIKLSVKNALKGAGKRHCKRCARTICRTCSDQERQLSRSDNEKHRICDICETEMDNHSIKAIYTNEEDKKTKKL